MPDADTFRLAVLSRGWGICEGCGTKRGIEAHHRQPRGMGGVSRVGAIAAHSPANGLGLCRTCHDWVDMNATIARELGWLVPHPLDYRAVPARIYTPQGPGWWFLDHEGGYLWCSDSPQTCWSDVLPGLTV